MIEVAIKTKTCSVCEEIKRLTEYYSRKVYSKSKGHHIYYNPECQECTKERSDTWNKNNKEHRRKLAIKYYEEGKWVDYKRENSKKQRDSGYYLNWQRSNKNKIIKYNNNRNSKKHNITREEWESCKEYFNYQCAYCGITEEEHEKEYNEQLHKEHVIDFGRNDLKNCIPSCRICNSEKHTKSLNNWYNVNNHKYDYSRYLKIYKWLRYDCLLYLVKKTE